MLAQGTLQANVNSLFVIILPDGVTAMMGSDPSCQAFLWLSRFVQTQRSRCRIRRSSFSALCADCGGEIGDFTAVYAHELAEAATDKIPGQGWVADDGQETPVILEALDFIWMGTLHRIRICTPPFRATTQTNAGIPSGNGADRLILHLKGLQSPRPRTPCRGRTHGSLLFPLVS